MASEEGVTHGVVDVEAFVLNYRVYALNHIVSTRAHRERLDIEAILQEYVHVDMRILITLGVVSRPARPTCLQILLSNVYS